MIICIDSNIIIWGIKKQASTGQEINIAKAEYFFEWADENGHEIIIPSVVLGEILVPEPAEIRQRYVEILSSAFLIVNFDTRAALKYAQILHNRLPEIKSIAEANSIAKQRMKIDHTIIATAVVNNANCIYSNDGGLKGFAAGHIDVRDLPSRPPKPLSLFDDMRINKQNEPNATEEGEEEKPF